MHTANSYLVIYKYFEKRRVKNCAKRHTAAVCKFLGGHFFLFGSECGTAQFSLFLFPLFPLTRMVSTIFCLVELIDLDLNDDDIFDQSEA